jgi:hypothetical protein
MLRRFQTTSEGWLPTSHPCFVDPNSAAVPGMPTVTDLPRLGAMGIVSMSCTIAAAHTWRWRKTARNPDRSSRQTLDGSLRFRKLVGCIIVMSGAPPEQTTSIRTTCRRVLMSKLVVCSISVLALSAPRLRPVVMPVRKIRVEQVPVANPFFRFSSHLVGNSGADSILRERQVAGRSGHTAAGCLEVSHCSGRGPW